MGDGGVFEDYGAAEDVREEVAGARQVVGYEGDLAQAGWVVGWHCGEGGQVVREWCYCVVGLGGLLLRLCEVQLADEVAVESLLIVEIL